MNKTDKIIIAVVAVILLGAVIGGFWLTGSPFTLENEKLDSARLSDFNSLRTGAQAYMEASGTLPASLSDFPSYDQSVEKDPASGKQFDYAITSSSSFNLCANFSDNSKNEGQGANYYNVGGTQETHTKGYDCIPFTVTLPTVNQTPIERVMPTAPSVPTPVCSFGSNAPMKTVAPGVSLGLTGDSSYTTTTPGGVPQATLSVCLWWEDTVSSTAKTYTILRGYGQYNLPASEMTKMITVSSTDHTFLDETAGTNPCYALELNDGGGHMYTSSDACF